MKLILVSILLFFTTVCKSQSYYNTKGQAIFYYKSTDNCFYDYSGNPLYYLKKSSNSSDGSNILYDFDGKLIGWQKNNVLYNKQGDIFSVNEFSKTNIIFGFEPIRQLEKFQPLKKIEELESIKPFFTNRFIYYAPINSNNNNNGSGSTNQSSPFTIETSPLDILKVQPTYSIPFETIQNAMDNAQRQNLEKIREAQIMTNNGYEYYDGNWYPKNQIASIKEKEIKSQNKTQREKLSRLAFEREFCDSRYDLTTLKTGVYKSVIYDGNTKQGCIFKVKYKAFQWFLYDYNNPNSKNYNGPYGNRTFTYYTYNEWLPKKGYAEVRPGELLLPYYGLKKRFLLFFYRKYKFK